jgi:hypothetical protein
LNLKKRYLVDSKRATGAEIKKFRCHKIEAADHLASRCNRPNRRRVRQSCHILKIAAFGKYSTDPVWGHRTGRLLAMTGFTFQNEDNCHLSVSTFFGAEILPADGRAVHKRSYYNHTSIHFNEQILVLTGVAGVDQRPGASRDWGRRRVA